MTGRPRPPLADWLQYLVEIGYGEARSDLARPPGSHRPLETPSAPSDAADTAPFSSAALPESRGDNLQPAAAHHARAEELRAVAARAERCTACQLAHGRNRVVFGSGPEAARLMFVGEGPGAEEDRQGLPFVGRAGELLTRIVAAIEMRRDEVYIANIVKCRPPGNREPEPEEVEACRGFLEKQIDLVRPAVIVCLGRVAAQTLLGSGLPISKMRGNWFTVRGVETMVTYHPAALLRNPALKRPTWEDMQKVRDRLREHD